MKTRVTKHFKIFYEKGLEDFVNSSLKIFEEKKSLIQGIFDDFPTRKITASFFTDRISFVDYIKKISNGHEPPSWATGCFYNEEIQTLINLENKLAIKKQEHTLTHEFIHLCFGFYDDLNIPRICWFDESYAGFIDGSKDNISINKLKEIATYLKKIGKFDMNSVYNSNKYITDSYNAYDMFTIIGKYIFDNQMQKRLLEQLKTDYKKIMKLGKTILADSIKYIENLET